MTLKSIAEFEAQQRKELEEHKAKMSVVAVLPTNGRTVTWVGEGGFESDGNTRKPDLQKTIQLVPYIVHGKFRDSHHVAFKIPGGSQEDGEYPYSQHRAEFRHAYIKSLLDACDPDIVELLAIKGRYASYVPASWDWENDRDYKDAELQDRGEYEIEASAGRGFSSIKLQFYVTTSLGAVKISIDVEDCPRAHKLSPRPIYNHNVDIERAVITEWKIPETSVTQATHVWRRGSGDSRNDSARAEYLYANRTDVERALGLLPEGE